MLSIWLSNQERGERVRHSLWLFLAFIFFSCFLFLLNLPSVSSTSVSYSLSSLFSALKNSKLTTQTVRYFCLSILVLFTLFLVYGSAGELLSLFVPPKLFLSSKKYHWIFTLLVFAPLLCTLCISIANRSDNKSYGNFKLSSASHYLFFQFYFLLGNRVGWKFLSKFLAPEIERSLEGQIGALERKGAQKIGSKLFKQHYLGWTSFFLLALFLPFWVLILVIAISLFNNSLSFFFGRKLGSTRISDYSPSKTLEGSIASFLLSVFFFSVFSILIFKQNWIGQGNFYGKETEFCLMVILLVFSSSFFSLWGDQRFSLCKRALGYKNFGRIFGKRVGGFWDRCDSLAPSLFSSSLIFWVSLAILKGDIGILNEN